MKNITYTMLSLCLLALYSCGMTEPWKDWENEGKMNDERLRPSEVKKLLCEADGWKMTYEGVTFYFTFAEDGTVNSDSNDKLLDNAVDTEYTLDFQGEKAVLLTLPNGGMIQYLGQNQESTFVITGYSDSEITAKGQAYGKEMILVPATAAEMQQAKESKRLAIIAYRKAQAIGLLESEFNNGVFRKASSAFMAHYLIVNDENQWSVKISAIVDGAVEHTVYPMTIDTTGEEDAVLTFDGATIEGITLNKFYYNYLSGEIRTNSSDVKCDTRKASDIIAWYTSGDWRTHVIDNNEIHADFKGLFHAGMEFDDRNPRNIVACPWNGMGSYIGINPSMKVDDKTGRVFIQLGDAYDLFGWNNNPDDYARVQTDYEKFLSFCSSDGGLYWTYGDNDNMVYVLSAVGGQWFRMKP